VGDSSRLAAAEFVLQSSKEHASLECFDIFTEIYKLWNVFAIIAPQSSNVRRKTRQSAKSVNTPIMRERAGKERLTIIKATNDDEPGFLNLEGLIGARCRPLFVTARPVGCSRDDATD
jgi:hypothetical protein